MQCVTPKSGSQLCRTSKGMRFTLYDHDGHTTKMLWQSVLHDNLQNEQVGTDDRSGIVLMA